MLELTPAVPISDHDRAELLDFAVTVAEAAAAETLPFFRRGPVPHNKGTDESSFDPVTQADRAAEQMARQMIGDAYPDHGVLGEEYGASPGNGLTWVIDPVDGTRAFISGLLHWGLLLALFDGEYPVVGAMVQPFTGETFAGDGRHAWYRRGREHRTLACRQDVTLDRALAATTTPRLYRSEAEQSALARIEAATRLLRFGGDCYLYAMLAMGELDLVMDPGLQPYDIQGLIPIIEGAGGVVSCHDGSSAAMGGFVVAAGSARLHAEALALIAGAGSG